MEDTDGDSKGPNINEKEDGTDSIIIKSPPTTSNNKQTETTSNSEGHTPVKSPLQYIPGLPAGAQSLSKS